MVDYIADAIGYKKGDQFIVKELSFIKIEPESEPVTFHFKAPRDISPPPALWLEQSFHGLKYQSGKLSYKRLKTLKYPMHYDTIFVIGEEKMKWFREIWPNKKFSNLEDVGCPSVYTLINDEEYPPCRNHTAVTRGSPVCAKQNVIKTCNWLLNQLNFSNNINYLNHVYASDTCDEDLSSDIE